jgi:hypothetical protein
MTKKKLDDVQLLPKGDFLFWFGQYILSAFALKFFHKNKRFPVSFSKSSVRVRGRIISMEME